MDKYCSSNLLSVTHFISLQLLLHTSLSFAQSAPYLLFANRPYVQTIHLNGTAIEVIYSENEAITNFVAMDLDMRSGIIYMSDNIQHEIVRGNVDGTAVQTVVDIQTDLTSSEAVGSIAYDWISHKVYWTNIIRRRVVVLDPQSSFSKVLLDFAEDTSVIPRMIVLDPLRRLMYWSAWNPTVSQSGKVYRTSMDGENTTVILQSDTVTYPNGLALDFITQTLYLVDGSHDIVAKFRTDGTEFTLIYNLIDGTRTRANPVQLEYYHGIVYFSEQFESSIFSLRVNTPAIANDPQLLKMLSREVGNMRIVDAERQQPLGPNPCEENNGGCSHLCLLSATHPLTYSCVCPDSVDPSNCSSATTAKPTLEITTSYNPTTSADTTVTMEETTFSELEPNFTVSEAMILPNTSDTTVTSPHLLLVTIGVLLATTTCTCYPVEREAKIVCRELARRKGEKLHHWPSNYNGHHEDHSVQHGRYLQS